jgi:hypothetical protein
MADKDHLRQPRRQRRQNDTVEPTAAAAVVAPAATPPPPPLMWPRWLHLMAPLPRPLDWHRLDVAWFSEGGGGRRPATSPIGHAGRHSPLWSSSVACWPDLCAAPGASTFGGVDTVDDLRLSPLRSSSAAGRPDLHVAPSASTSGGVDTVDELFGPAATSPLIPHHDDGSSRNHQLGCRFRCFQPHHFQCRQLNLYLTASPH